MEAYNHIISASMASRSSLFFFVTLLTLVVVFHCVYWLSSSHRFPNIEVYKEEDQITKAPWNEDHKIMSKILKDNFWRLRQCLEEKPYDDHGKFTIFAPRDEEAAIGSERYDDHKYHSLVLRAHVVKYFVRPYFSPIFKGKVYPTCDPTRHLVVTNASTNDRGFVIHKAVYINHSRIVGWNIYNGKHVVVHEVENFFVVDESRTTIMEATNSDGFDRFKELLQKQYRKLCYYFLFLFGVLSFFVHIGVLSHTLCKGFSSLLRLLLVPRNEILKDAHLLGDCYLIQI